MRQKHYFAIILLHEINFGKVIFSKFGFVALVLVGQQFCILLPINCTAL